MKQYTVATDGLCKNNQAKGGQPGCWAFCVFNTSGKYLGHRKGHNKETTNNEMELVAIIEALRWATKHEAALKIRSDSNYCVKAINEWSTGWVKRGWKKADGSPVMYANKFREVLELMEQTGSSIEWVKGHSGDSQNDMADMYCNEEYINTFI